VLVHPDVARILVQFIDDLCPPTVLLKESVIVLASSDLPPSLGLDPSG
jgi:hypothetical protein